MMIADGCVLPEEGRTRCCPALYNNLVRFQVWL